MNALIFGASGQDGHYLSEACRARGVTPIGVSRTGSPVRGDVSDFDQVRTLVRQHTPAYVFQLAAASTTRHEALFENHATISTGALNVLEAVRLHCPDARVFLAGSGLQFVNTGEPISERAPFEASSPYAVARIQSVHAARYYRSLGIKVYVGYLFHHESPRRKPEHVSKMIALAALRIAAGDPAPLVVGSLDVEKEWTFAGDVARAMFTLVSQDTVFEAAIGSGLARTIRAWTERCFSLLGMDWQEHVRTRDGYVPEYRRLVSDPATIRGLGWEPTVGFDDLAELMVRAGA